MARHVQAYRRRRLCSGTCPENAKGSAVEPDAGLRYGERDMRKVLLVDDEELFLRSLVDSFKNRNDSTGLSFLTASDGTEALELLKKQKVDLVITDLQMPRMDGFELLSEMGRAFDEVPVIVMTAFGTEEIQNDAAGAGAVRFIDKPIDIEVLAQMMHEVLESSASGFVNGIQIPEFVQIINAGRKSCTLEVSGGGRKGRLFFSKGKLVDAECDGGKKGLEAALEIVTWREGAIKIGGNFKRKKNRVNMSVNALLMEAMYQKDERERSGEGEEVDLDVEDFDLENAFSEPQPPADNSGGVVDAQGKEAKPGAGFSRQEHPVVSQQQIEEALLQLGRIDGSHGGVLVDNEGVVIVSRLDERFADDKIAALTAAAVETANRVVREAGFGTTDTMLIEGTEAKLCLIRSDGGGYFISLVGSSRLNIGMARVALKDALEELKDL